MNVRGRLIVATLVLLSVDTTAMAQSRDRDMQAMPTSSSSAAAPMAGMAMQDMPGMDMPPTKRKPVSKAVPVKHPHPAPASVNVQPNDAMSSPIHTDPAMPMRAPNDHVPPPAPRQPLSAMSPTQMVDTMQMNDQATRAMWMFDRLEYRDATRGEDSAAWNAEGWWGDDLNKLWLKTEGEHDREGTRDASADLLWSHATSTFWDWQLGARHDFGQGPSREWAAAGVQGRSPYWFEIAATFYAGPQGRTAARLEADYDLLFTQRLILSPDLELNFYGKDDPQRDTRSGLAEAEAGLRLRYEFSRRFAPYVGIDWTRHFGHFDSQSNDLPARDTTFVAGVRFWF
ncbi:copper resistance protein B [Rhodanobacter sp. MP7CTX1]|uniref:copper resistance protein B n=1 Tax=Rhodanobacter sp. MP7CTX1 TaxID=2723084 RepID=UPI0017D0F37C|nr:copper resistance protein B [Rhodanobacter sp. MP7CTX1]MBB6189105.1 copper resistance protein B [Rhodanobacter sp. MP7CTX1]